jgi:hypothetical protein
MPDAQKTLDLSIGGSPCPLVVDVVLNAFIDSRLAPARDYCGSQPAGEARPSLPSILTIATNAFRSKTVSVGSVSTPHETL